MQARVRGRYSRVILLLIASILLAMRTVTSFDFGFINNDGFSASYCAENLCKTYSSAMKQYLSDGCEGDFTQYVTSSNGSSFFFQTATLASVLKLGFCAFVGAFMGGFFLARQTALTTTTRPYYYPHKPI